MGCLGGLPHNPVVAMDILGVRALRAAPYPVPDLPGWRGGAECAVERVELSYPAHGDLFQSVVRWVE